MTEEQVRSLSLGIEPVDTRTILLVESAFHWINENTTFNFDFDSKIPPNVKLFILKYFDVMTMPVGVTSESIEGLSQSYDSSTKSDLLWQYAYELLGNHLKSQMSFVSAKKRWR